MVDYKCIECQKLVEADTVRKKVRCPYCGSKILTKPKLIASKVEAI